MEMNTRGIGALALLGALLLGSTAAHGSETLNTILGGGAGGVAGTMIGKELGVIPARWWGLRWVELPVARRRPTRATRMKRPLAARWGAGRCRHRQECWR